ncbi:MAG: Clp protease N-terminal domain-containing protein [Polyangiales bacterium]
MQPPATPSARALIDRARAIAADARVTPGTLHLLAAVFESPSTLARALRSRGLRANDLRSLRGPVDEPLNALSRSMERAQQLAAQRGVTEVTGELLFVAALVERECAMVKLLRANGHDPVRLAEELAGLLPVARPAPVQRAVAAPAARPVARVAGMGPTAPVPQNRCTMLSRVRLSPRRTDGVSVARAPRRPRPLRRPRPRPRHRARSPRAPRDHRARRSLRLPPSTCARRPCSRRW